MNSVVEYFPCVTEDFCAEHHRNMSQSNYARDPLELLIQLSIYKN